MGLGQMQANARDGTWSQIICCANFRESYRFCSGYRSFYKRAGNLLRSAAGTSHPPRRPKGSPASGFQVPSLAANTQQPQSDALGLAICATSWALLEPEYELILDTSTFPILQRFLKDNPVM